MTQSINDTLATMNFFHRGTHYDNNLLATAALVQRAVYEEWTVRLDPVDVGLMMKNESKKLKN